MKTVFILSFSFIVIAFILLSIDKEPPPQETDTGDESNLTSEKEKIQLFWEIYRLASEQRIAGNLDSAAAGYRRALKYNDRHEDALYYLGNVCLDTGDPEGAQICWKKLLAVNPKSARAYFQLGNLYLNNDDYFNAEKAAQCFHHVLEINSEESGSVYYLGQVELIRNNINAARHIFETLSGSNYNNLNASFFKSYIDWKSGKRDRAISEMRKALLDLNTPPAVSDMSAEGDTKLGKPLYNTIQNERKSLFYIFLNDLPELTVVSLQTELDKRFNRLDDFLAQLRVRNGTGSGI